MHGFIHAHARACTYMHHACTCMYIHAPCIYIYVLLGTIVHCFRLESNFGHKDIIGKGSSGVAEWHDFSFLAPIVHGFRPESEKFDSSQ